jgi:exosortase
MTSPTKAIPPSRSGFIDDWITSPARGVVIPHVLCVVALLPYLLLYFTQLMRMRPHYQFVPFALAATGAAIYMRWPRGQAHPFRSSRLANAFFIAGCLFGCGAVLFSWPRFAAIGAFSFVTSFCARTIDGETGKTMLSATLPMWIGLTLPFNLDFSLITWLQVFSARAASHALDLLGYHHHLAGTVLNFPERDYGIAEACSGVQSFFTLLFLTSVFVVFLHRPWFRSLLLLASALFWAILMNAVRILIIPVVHSGFGIDLSSGLKHEILGYAVLIIGGLLVLSTDQFLTFLFGPVEATTIDSSTDAVGKVARFWNRIIAGSEAAGAKARSKLPSRATRWMISAGAALMLVIGTLSIGTAWQMLTSGYLVRFFKDVQLVALDQNDLPKEIEDWRWIRETENSKPYLSIIREASSDLGLRSDQWIYQVGQTEAIVALDQPFAGWHELTTCYQNNGWNLVTQGRAYKEANDKDGKSWPYIQVDLDRPTGEKAFLLFSFFDALGEPFEAPTDWGTINKFLIRVRNRLSPEVRARLFESESYQVQLFVRSSRLLTDEERETVRSRFLEIRELLRQAYLKRRPGEGPAGTPPDMAAITPSETPIAHTDSK